MLEASEAYAKAAMFLQKPPDKVMHASTFINSGRWKDWIPPDGAEYADAREIYRRNSNAHQPREQPPRPDLAYLNEGIVTGGEETGT